MSLHSIYIIAMISCLYMGNGLRISRDTEHIPTHKFKPIKSDDSEWTIHQSSSSSVRAIGKDNTETFIPGPDNERGFGRTHSGHNYTYESIQHHSSGHIVSSDSNTTYRYDSWDVTTPSSVKRARNFHANDSPILSNRRNSGTSQTQGSDDDVTPMSHLEDGQLNVGNKSIPKVHLDNGDYDDLVPAEGEQTRQQFYLDDDEGHDIVPIRRGQSPQGYGLRPKFHLESDEEDDLVSIERDRSRQGLRHLPISPSENDEEDDLIPIARGPSRQRHGLFRKTYLDNDKNDGLVPTRRSQSRQRHGFRPNFYFDSDEEDDLVSIERDRSRQGLRHLPISPSENNEEDDLFPIGRNPPRQGHGLRRIFSLDNDEEVDFVPAERGQSMTAKEFRLHKLRENPNHVIFSKPL
ncbi:uncharacterized protein [Drosophila tropicalis]|uniref:uncharacterized protein isoform X2 n=1 Tax=Drosophila tropicalis TaxID=46794 RepID=UPI0035ABEE4A